MKCKTTTPGFSSANIAPSVLLSLFLMVVDLCPAYSYDLSTESSTRTTLFSTTNVDFSGSDSLAPTKNTTALSTYDGTTYFVWVDANDYPQVTRISSTGVVQTVRLDLDDSYEVYPDGHHTFSLGIDSDGYVHVVGDMHNFDPLISGSNIPDYLDRFDNANIMYWVSDTNNPQSTLTFSFVGDDLSRTVPGSRFSYCKFYNDRNLNLYMLARIQLTSSFVPGCRGVGLYRYDAATQSWVARGALPPSSFTPSDSCILWEDNGHSGGGYQGFMATLAFDMYNRMHFASTINNNDASPDATHVLYAYSDDGGLTFHQATNDTLIPGLPMRASGTNAADVVADAASVSEYFWNHAGVFVDGQGTPAVTYWKKSDGGGVPALIQHFDPASQTWSAPYNNPVSGTSMVQHVTDASGVNSYIEKGNYGMICRSLSHNAPAAGTWNFRSLVSLDRLALREDGVHLFVGSTGDYHLSVEKIEYLNTGSYTREVWTGVSGNSISDLTSHAQFPLSPNITEEVSGDLVGPTDWGENYGARLRGMLHPPESGNYTFLISGDNNCEFWLSEDATIEGASKIAEVKTWTYALTHSNPEQISASIYLEAGRRYYFEVLHKEGGANDHLAVSWTTPSDSTVRVIPSSHLSPWAGIPVGAVD